MARVVALLGCIVVFLTLAPARAGELFASPQGKAGAAGTRADPLDLPAVLAGKGGAKPGDTVWLLPGTYHAPEKDGKRVGFQSVLQGTADQPITLRAVPGKRVTLDGWLDVQGAFTTYWGLEVADSTFTDRTEAGAKDHPTSINAFGPGTKFINLDVHDGAMGFGLWSPAVDAEVYGCIIHDFGYAGKDRGHGHAIYTQNEKGTKRIVDNVMFRGYGWNLHAYTQGGHIDGFHVEGNISFAAGTRVPRQVADDFLVMGYPPADRITVLNNYAYHAGHSDKGGDGPRPVLRLDCYKNRVNGTCLVKDNILMGVRGLQLGQWRDATVTGNTVWGPSVCVAVQPPEGKFGNYKWDGNTYVHTGQAAPFVITGKSAGMTFDDWKKQTGFDTSSRVIEGQSGRPAGTQVFVRPNRYEPGRGHVAVYNWDRKPAVDVDLGAVLKQGARYEVHNVQDDLYGKPAAAGTYDGKPVRLPTKRSEIAPDFDAFLVVTVGD